MLVDPLPLRLVAAIGRRGEIGRDGGLLFRLKSDMAHFRALTSGKPVLMGRRTWDSLPRRPLPGRPNLVVTRNAGLAAPGASVWSHVATAIAAARAMAAGSGAEEVCVIGGADIYAACLPFATHLSLTEVEAQAEADAFFPAFDRAQWREVSARAVSADADNEAGFVIRDLARRD
jgi:dihydrofolate reductase